MFKLIIRRLLPPQWHEIKIFAFMRVVTTHLDRIQNEYDKLKREIEFCLMWGSQVCQIEEMLRCLFKCDGIFISDPTPDPRLYIFWHQENQICPIVYWNEEGEQCDYIKWCEEYEDPCDFIVNVPRSCENYITQICAWVSKVKLVNVTFCVVIFDT